MEDEKQQVTAALAAIIVGFSTIQMQKLLNYAIGLKE